MPLIPCLLLVLLLIVIAFLDGGTFAKAVFSRKDFTPRPRPTKMTDEEKRAHNRAQEYYWPLIPLKYPEVEKGENDGNTCSSHPCLDHGGACRCNLRGE